METATQQNDSLISIIDQGTSSTKCVFISLQTGVIIAKCQVPVSVIYPSPDWVEINSNEIYESTLNSLNICVRQIGNMNLSIKVRVTKFLYIFLFYCFYKKRCFDMF